MNASRLDTRQCKCRGQGGLEARRVALEARRAAFIHRTLNPGDAPRHRVVAIDALSASLLAERDRLDVDYAAGEGY